MVFSGTQFPGVLAFVENRQVKRIYRQGAVRDSPACNSTRNVVDETTGCLRQYRYVLHDRDAKFCPAFDELMVSGSVHSLRLPPRSPNLNAFARTLEARGLTLTLSGIDTTLLPDVLGEFQTGTPVIVYLGPIRALMMT